jgi:hypothetical protein
MKGKISKNLADILKDPVGRNDLREALIKGGGEVPTSDGRTFTVTNSRFVADEYMENDSSHNLYK